MIQGCDSNTIKLEKGIEDDFLPFRMYSITLTPKMETHMHGSHSHISNSEKKNAL